MIIAQLMRAFPGSHFSVRAVGDAWEVCVLHGALQPGMGQWLDNHNLRAERVLGVDGYVIRWLSVGPMSEKRMFESVKRLADIGYRAAQQRRLFSASEERSLDKHLNAFIVAAKEIEL